MAGDLGISLYRNKNGEDTLNISFGGATLPEPSVANANFTNPGYNFKYWSTSRTDASSGTRYEAGTVTSQIPYGTNLYAIWEADYIDSIKTSDNIEHPIKDTISGYITSASVPSASSTTPKMDGTAAVGTETAFARGDHVHPTDTSRASLDIVAPEWEPNVDYWEWDSVIYQGQLYFCHEAHVSSSTWDSSKWTPITVGGLAYIVMSEKIDDPSTKTSGQFLKYNGTTWVAGDVPEGSAASSTTPKMDGTASTGSENAFARGDHIHPTDTSRQAVLVSGTNIKTINNESILGSGNISISAGSSDVFIAEYGVTTYADILAAYEAGKAIFCQKIASSSLNNTKIVSILPLAYIGSSDQTASVSRKAIFKNMSGNYSLDQTNITSWTVSGVSGQWSSENIETYTGDPGILSINKSGNSTYLYSNPVNGIVKDDGTGVLSAAVAGTDYQAPLTFDGTYNASTNKAATVSTVTNAIAAAENVFVVTYGTTTYADITAALNANKLLFCYVSWNDIVCPYIGVVNSQYAFSNLGAGESTVSLYVNSSNQWSYATSNLATQSAVNAKQDALVSGTNIKTINNESLLGSGNINISGGGGDTLFVKVTYSNYTYTADTTYADMATAIAGGKDIAVILVDATQQLSWYYAMVYAPKTTSENFCFATENELGLLKHLLVNVSDAWWTVDVNISDYAKKASPTFTGTPKAPTATAGTNTTQIATTAFVKTAIDNAIGSAISASY